jgi:hypothetical protein
VKDAALLVGKVITVVVRHQVDNGPFGQRCRLVENEPPLLDTCSERAHANYSTAFWSARQGFGSLGAERTYATRWGCSATPPAM